MFRSHWDGPRLLDLIAEHGGGPDPLADRRGKILRHRPNHRGSRRLRPLRSGDCTRSDAACPGGTRLDPNPAERTENCEPPAPAPTALRRSGRAVETLRASRHGRAGAGRALRPVPPPTGLLLASAIWQGTGGGAGHLRDRRPHRAVAGLRLPAGRLGRRRARPDPRRRDQFPRDRLPAAGRPGRSGALRPRPRRGRFRPMGCVPRRLVLAHGAPPAGPDARTCVTPTGGCRRSRSTGRSRSRPAAGKPTTRGSVSSGTTCSSSAGRPWNHASGTPTAT